eukprot:scaffold105_cov78-Skeletonema_dohrnii-CCMP3373.AAC.2
MQYRSARLAPASYILITRKSPPLATRSVYYNHRAHYRIPHSSVPRPNTSRSLCICSKPSGALSKPSGALSEHQISKSIVFLSHYKGNIPLPLNLFVIIQVSSKL